MQTTSLFSPNVPEPSRPARKKKQRDLGSAEALRPAEVYALYGIPSSTLCQLCNHPDPAKRLPSVLTPGRQGRKGLRIIFHSELRAWLFRWRVAQTTEINPTNPKAA